MKASLGNLLHCLILFSVVSSGAQDAVGLLWCEGVLLAHAWLVVDQDPKILFCRATSQSAGPQPKTSLKIFQEYVWSYPCKKCLMTNSSITWGVQYTLLWIFCWSKISLQKEKKKNVKTKDTSNRCCIRFPWVQSILKTVLAWQKVSTLLLV